jgi:DNA-binding NtrC family response regulator
MFFNKHPKNVLVVEDDKRELGMYLDFLREKGFEARGCFSLDEAERILSHYPIGLLLSDLHLSGNSAEPEGLTLINRIQKEYPHIIPIAMSLDLRPDLAARARRAGALHFIRKPINNADELHVYIDQALESKSLNTTARLEAKERGPQEDEFPHGIVIAPEVLKYVDAAAKYPEMPVIIRGETGTGKEEIARLIHRLRRREEGNLPFIPVNCATLDGNLINSTLFGHTKGAFTGADTAHSGLVADADGGILFLDEIHCLSLDTQRRLLRVLNDGSYSKVGSNIELKSRFQVIVASTKDLDEQVDDGTFLLDLATRLTGIDILLTPLRERIGELPHLIRLFFQKRGINISDSEVHKLAQTCGNYYWQGNIRLLYHKLHYLVIHSKINNEPIKAENLQVCAKMFAPRQINADQVKNKMAFKDNQEIAEPLFNIIKLIKRLEFETPTFAEIIESIEQQVLVYYLSRYKRSSDLVEAIKISRSTLDYKRKRYGI